MLILLTCKEPKNTFVDTVLRVKKVHEGGGALGTANFSYKMHFLLKCLVVALDEVEVHI